MWFELINFNKMEKEIDFVSIYYAIKNNIIYTIKIPLAFQKLLQIKLSAF
jgi:hypothetical protein